MELKADVEALEQMQKIGGEWFAYQNADFKHPQFGHLKFLKCGKGCTYEQPPMRLPDTSQDLNWRYYLRGTLNLETGEVVENKR